MIENSKSEFQLNYALFRMREGEIDKEAKGKLYYIASRINSQLNHCCSSYDKNTEEAKQLAQLDQKSLTILFNTLVRTLLSQKKVLERQCKIKFNGFFQFWKDAKIIINSKEFIVAVQKFKYKYNLKNLGVVNKRRNKKCFDIVVKEKTMGTLKFQKGQFYEEVIHFVQRNIQKSKHVEELAFQKMESSPEKFRKSRRKQRSFFTEEEIKLIQNKIIEEKLSNYVRIQQNDNVCIMEAKDEPKIHVSIMLSTKSSLIKVVNYYLQQEQWCSAIASQYITEEEPNVFEVFRVFKKDSFFQMERGTLTKVKVHCTKSMAQITQQTQDYGKRDNKLVCSVTSTAKFYASQKGIKILVDCSFDGKGFYQSQDSRLFLRRWFQELLYFENFKLTQLQGNQKMLVSQSQKKSDQTYFREEQSYLSSSRMKMVEIHSSNIGTSDTLQNSNQTESDPQYLFLKLKPVKPTQKPLIQYLNMVINQGHYRYYRKSYFDQSTVKNYDDYTPNYILPQLLKNKQYEINSNKELVYINKQVIKGQKGSLLFVIKQVGANIISGKSVLNVSLPVDIFQPRTLLQRSASSFGITPDYLLPIAEADPLTQIKNIITLFSTIPTGQLIMLKPFNPILGQTFQAYIKGIPIYYEQISHHPPISSFYMTCPEFTMHGNLAAFADLSLNSAVGGNQGITYIKMKNGSQFQCYFPPCQITGLIFGDRTFRAYGKGYILQKKSNLFAQISIEDYKKGLYEKNNEKLYPGSILGGIFKIKPQIMQQISSQKSLRKFSGLKPKDIVQKLAQIKGTWFEEIIINNKVMNKNIKVYPLQYPKIALPSDANYRLDVLYHKIQDIPQSQKQKQILQIRQRADKKLRQKNAKVLRRKK